MPYYVKDPKRDPNFDNHPFGGLNRFRTMNRQVARLPRGKASPRVVEPSSPEKGELLGSGFVMSEFASTFRAES